jgi:hypothetical protein
MTVATREFVPVFDLDRVPSEVSNSSRAVVWNLEERDGKPTKVPYVSRRPTERASVNDPTTWGSFAEARAAVEDGKADGVGIVLGDGLVGIDIDDCRDPDTGAIDPVARAIIDVVGSYTEITPSGCGVHILVRGLLPPIGRRKGNIEMYDAGRYFTITGNHLDGTPTTIEERTPDLAALHAQIFSATTEAPLLRTPELDDDELLQRAREARNGAKFAALWTGDTSGYASPSEADLALCSLLAFWTSDPTRVDCLFRQSRLMRPKWDERRGDGTYGERTTRRALARQHKLATGVDATPSKDPSSDSATALPSAGKASQATRIVNMALEQGVELFHDLDDNAYMDVQVSGHHEIYSLRSRRGRMWLAGRHFQDTGKAAGSQSLADAINVLEAYALQADRRRVDVRIGRLGDAVYVDLGDDSWRTIEITEDGWRLLERSPLPFKRPRGLAALPDPVRGGSINELRPFLNLADDDDFVLIAAFLLSCLRGQKPYPILIINGEYGSAKSSTAAFIRALIDPNVAPLRSEPGDARDLMIAASNSHILAFDNLSHVRLADDLSRLATGAGFSTRTLFENREEEIFEAARPIILNGIPELASQPDLVSRSLFVTLPAISDTNRRDERELWSRFEAARGRILGGLLDAVVEALRRSRTVRLVRKPRMADVALWIAAAEPACPWQPGRFLEVYDSNRRGTVDAVLDGDIVAATAESLAPWLGTASDFLGEVNKRASDEQKRDRHWFKRPRQVRDALKRLAPPLREHGIDVTFGEKDTTRKRNRLIRIEQVATASSVASDPSGQSAPVSAIGGRISHDESREMPIGSSAHLTNRTTAADAMDAADAQHSDIGRHHDEPTDETQR